MKKCFLLFAIISTISMSAQDDLLNELETNTKNNSFELPAFKAMKIGNLQSTKVADKGDFYLIVSHRFGSLENGLDTFFGLDNANTKIQFVWSWIDGVQFSVSRESLKKTYAGAVKLRLFRQSKKSPFNIVGYWTFNINSALDKNVYPLLKFEDRLSYASQLLISRRFSNKFSFEIAPTYVRENLQDIRNTKEYNPDQFVLGVGGRYKLSKRMSVNVDYTYNFMRHENSIYNNPLTIGLDIDTGGHVFQLLFSNAQSTNEPGYMSNAEGDWSNGDIFFGFNIVRVF